MADLEELLRDTLAEHADGVTPASDAARDALRSARRRHRTRTAATTAAAGAACAVIATSAAVWHSTTSPPATTGNPVAPAGAPSASLPSPSPASATSSPTTSAATSDGPVPDPASLVAIFGPDWTPQPKGLSGFGGDYTLTPGSASAAGLPGGYHAAVSRGRTGPTLQSVHGAVDSLATLCQPLNEKGATGTGCTTETVNGKTVHRDLTEAPNTAVGTWATLRYLYQHPDHSVDYSEITVWSTTAPTTPEQRQQADTWLSTQSRKLATAATVAH